MGGGKPGQPCWSERKEHDWRKALSTRIVDVDGAVSHLNRLFVSVMGIQEITVAVSETVIHNQSTTHQKTQ
ncbi:hypothetical protein BBBOND_0307840 [Babesia bigemina]|uniref:Uncharacterized protein n=1 Tax=Babesia bigemina TaxID=5866 RepID=A0A061DE71_BABBI|nr:hypothetical protein BBBOND_0307840 [Babesia bigemina]CDR96880.1 hypothetical protein BBBOND_0307840 [Babesia bigemina]|eukprot:XP_012769066.1 hypothetical protein BBBOND_0307840 [Babesia bigemina]